MQSAYEKYGRALLRKAERLLRNRDDAEDIVHALFADLLHQDPTPMDLPYLYRAVTNRCLSHLRDHKNRQRILASAPPEPSFSRAEDVYLDSDLVLRLLARLESESCQILVYRFFDDMTLEEIADLTQMSRKTIAKRLETIRALVVALTAEADKEGGTS